MYIKTKPNQSGAYPAPQSRPAYGCVELPERFLADFINCNGFVTLTIKDGAVTALEPNTSARDAWQAEHPNPPEQPPAPTAQDDTDEMLVDLEFRVTLLELGVM